MIKKILSIAAIIVGAFTVLSGVAPMIIGAVLKAQVSDTGGIIGGADGPTAILVSSTLGAGSVVIELVIGILLVGAGIWGLRKSRKNG